MSIYRRNKKWWVDIKFNRVRHRKPSPENSRDGARAYEVLLRHRIATGEPIDGVKNTKEGETLKYSAYTPRWMKDYVEINNKLSEIRSKESALRCYLIPFFGRYRLTEITTYLIEKYKGEMVRKSLSNKYINNTLYILSKSLRCATEWEIIDSMPKIKYLRVPPTESDYLSSEECDKLLAKADGWLKDIILFALHTGLRFGELAALTWQEININIEMITVQNSVVRGRLDSTKSNRIRYIPMTNEVKCMLERRKNNSDTALVFPNQKGNYLIHERCREWLHELCAEAGIKKTGWHKLRHTFASHLAEKGVPTHTIQVLLGHSSPMTTMRYAHLGPVAIRESIKVLEKPKDTTIGHNGVTISETNKIFEYNHSNN